MKSGDVLEVARRSGESAQRRKESETETAFLRSAFLEDFTCLGDTCEDTCCKGWGMQLDPCTKARYEKEAPELLAAVSSGEAEWIMRRDPATDYCVKFENGLCGIHKSYGTNFLGDACHFFPRITRSLGAHTVMTAALSCPEVARLGLFGEKGCAHRPATTNRLPYSLKDYLPETLDAEKALTVHTAFLAACDDPTLSAERLMAQIISVARSMERLDKKTWPEAAPFYLKSAAARLPAPEPRPEDPFNLLHALAGLLGAAKSSPRPRLEQTLQEMSEALQVTLGRAPVSIAMTGESLPAWQRMETRWRDSWAASLQPVLKRWIALQLAGALFPFAGLGDTLTERVTILGVRFATVRLALMSCCDRHGGPAPQEEMVRVVQSIARFLDHLADPALSLAIYRETGWIQEPRLRALIGDTI